MALGANSRRGLAALIVGSGKSGSGDAAAPASSAGTVVESDAGGAGAAAGEAGSESHAEAAKVTADPYVDLAGELMDAVDSRNPEAIADVLRAVRGMPIE